MVRESNRAQNSRKRHPAARQPIAKSFPRPCQPTGDGSFFPAEFQGRLGLTLAVNATKQKRRSVLFWKTIHFFGQQRLQISPGTVGGWVRLRHDSSPCFVCTSSDLGLL